MLGLEDDPDPAKGGAVATSIFIAVAVYAVSVPYWKQELVLMFSKGFLLFCGSQAWLHVRASRRGAISLR